MGEGARAARGRRGVDPLWMVAVFVVGGALGTECALDAAWVHGSGEATLSRLEEVAGWANREMVLEAVRQDRRDVRGGEGVDREVSGEEVSGG